ncbi:hypothetical protein HK100_003462 [Physocladia obscura]|uniref:CCHC-type domain-containing protein n=1 Tax=Physocladia obscura TaxID=109957 RepID=A0AAD5XD73_9FUNG|nr:hypothetical protein HK100_003462 [Physocladia obscura]
MQQQVEEIVQQRSADPLPIGRNSELVWQNDAPNIPQELVTQQQQIASSIQQQQVLAVSGMAREPLEQTAYNGRDTFEFVMKEFAALDVEPLENFSNSVNGAEQVQDNDSITGNEIFIGSQQEAENQAAHDLKVNTDDLMVRKTAHMSLQEDVISGNNLSHNSVVRVGSDSASGEESDKDDLVAAFDAVCITPRPLFHSSCFQFKDGSPTQYGPGFSNGGKTYKSATTGNVYDTSDKPPGPCFNCEKRGLPSGHWRKHCPRRNVY